MPSLRRTAPTAAAPSIKRREVPQASSTPSSPAASAASTAGRASRARKPQVALPPTPATPPGSKQARIVAAVSRIEGATIAELMQQTGWLSHSVRGVISAVLKRKLGLAIDSRVEPGRGRVYGIASTVEVKTAGTAAARTVANQRRSKKPTAGAAATAG